MGGTAVDPTSDCDAEFLRISLRRTPPDTTRPDNPAPCCLPTNRVATMYVWVNGTVYGPLSLIANAAVQGNLATVRRRCTPPLCRVTGESPSDHNNLAVRLAAHAGHVAVVQFLCELPLELGVDPGAENNSALLDAVKAGKVDVVRYLCELPLGRGVNPGVRDSEALVLAARVGALSLVQYLCELPLERGVDPGAANNRALVVAAQNRHVHVVEYLCTLPLERGVNPGASNAAAVRLAVRQRDASLVQSMCQLPSALLLKQHSSVCALLAEQLGGSSQRLHAQLTSLGVVRPLAYVMVEQRPRLVREHAVSDEVVESAVCCGLWTLVRFLALELPGGFRWMPLIETTIDYDDVDDDGGVRRLLRVMILRQRVWRRHGCLLMLRMMRDAGRVRWDGPSAERPRQRRSRKVKRRLSQGKRRRVGQR